MILTYLVITFFVVASVATFKPEIEFIAMFLDIKLTTLAKRVINGK